jgi:hypothetical protein
VALAGLAALAALVLGGCEAQLEAAAEPGDTQVLVGRSSAGLTVEAPEWRPPQTLIYLCPTAPTRTATSIADAGTIVLGPDCRSFGKVDSSGGLTANLGFGTLDARQRPIFAAAPEWYLVLIEVRRATTDRVFRTAVQPIAIDPSITPGPPEPTPTPAGPSPIASAPG